VAVTPLRAQAAPVPINFQSVPISSNPWQSLPSEHKRLQFQSVPIRSNQFQSVAVNLLRAQAAPVSICSNMWQSLPSEHKRLQFQSDSNLFQSVPICGSHSLQSISGSSSNLFQSVPSSLFQSVPICGSHSPQSISGSSSCFDVCSSFHACAAFCHCYSSRDWCEFPSQFPWTALE